MTKARITKEAVVRVSNRIGVLMQVAKIVSDKGIDIVAVSAGVEGAEAVIRLVTSDHLRTMDAFREHKLNAQEARVVMTEVEHRPGMLRHITEKLTMENIDLTYLYASAAAGQGKSLIIFSSTNNDRAVVVLNE
jgi:hypothetical protein